MQVVGFLTLAAALPLGRGLPVPLLRVLAAFGPGGAGACTVSAVSLVSRAASSPSPAGRPRCLVSWWAGGGPSVPLPARLGGGSSALVSAVAASRPGRGLVAFVSGGPAGSPGSWRSLRLAWTAGLAVVVFPCACSPSCFPVVLGSRWVPAGSGVWASGWRLVPAGGPSPDSTSTTIHQLHHPKTISTKEVLNNG